MLQRKPIAEAVFRRNAQGCRLDAELPVPLHIRGRRKRRRHPIHHFGIRPGKRKRRLYLLFAELWKGGGHLRRLEEFDRRFRGRHRRRPSAPAVDAWGHAACDRRRRLRQLFGKARKQERRAEAEQFLREAVL